MTQLTTKFSPRPDKFLKSKSLICYIHFDSSQSLQIVFHPLFKGSTALCVTHADGDLSHPKAVRIPDLPDKFLYPLSFGKCPVNFDFFYIHKRVGIDRPHRDTFRMNN